MGRGMTLHPHPGQQPGQPVLRPGQPGVMCARPPSMGTHVGMMSAPQRSLVPTSSWPSMMPPGMGMMPMLRPGTHPANLRHPTSAYMARAAVAAAAAAARVTEKIAAKIAPQWAALAASSAVAPGVAVHFQPQHAGGGRGNTAIGCTVTGTAATATTAAAAAAAAVPTVSGARSVATAANRDALTGTRTAGAGGGATATVAVLGPGTSEAAIEDTKGAAPANGTKRAQRSPATQASKRRAVTPGNPAGAPLAAPPQRFTRSATERGAAIMTTSTRDSTHAACSEGPVANMKSAPTGATPGVVAAAGTAASATAVWAAAAPTGGRVWRPTRAHCDNFAGASRSGAPAPTPSPVPDTLTRTPKTPLRFSHSSTCGKLEQDRTRMTVQNDGMWGTAICRECVALSNAPRRSRKPS